MRIKFLNTEYFIGSCNNEDIPNTITKIRPAQEVAFFYCYQRDWIVLNEDNVNYEFYKKLLKIIFRFLMKSGEILWNMPLKLIKAYIGH